jgi:hypothetical protein
MRETTLVAAPTVDELIATVAKELEPVADRIILERLERLVRQRARELPHARPARARRDWAGAHLGEIGPVPNVPQARRGRRSSGWR